MSSRTTSLWSSGFLATMLAGSAVLAAHDFWLAPGSFHTKPGAVLSLSLRVGEHFDGEAVPRRTAVIERFVVAGPTGVAEVAGREDADPAGLLRPKEPGLYVVGYRSRPSTLSLDAAKFEQYLREEGLERIIEQRAARGEQLKPGRERYSRSAKSLVLVGDAPAPGFDRILGLTLEIVPEQDPYGSGGRGASFRLLFEGQPLEGTLVMALNRDRPREPLRARTDRRGRVTFEGLGPGVWLVKAVHMTAVPAGGDADWDSVWASLTFEKPTPSTRASAR
jgi:uncharacterized GH25 family protein